MLQSACCACIFKVKPLWNLRARPAANRVVLTYPYSQLCNFLHEITTHLDDTPYKSEVFIRDLTSSSLHDFTKITPQPYDFKIYIDRAGTLSQNNDMVGEKTN